MTARRRAPWIVGTARAHLRLLIAIALGIATYFILPGAWLPVTRALIGWNVGVAFYLITVAVVMTRSSIAQIKRRATVQDEGALVLLILTVGAAIASLGAIFVELSAAKNSDSGAGYIAIAISTVVLSWVFMHVIFALHYAHDFYGEGERANGLDFPGDEKPDYWDFIYFSFVIGMTFQVSDVGVTNKWIRRLVVAHGFVSFLFNTTIVALTVNIAANVI